MSVFLASHHGQKVYTCETSGFYKQNQWSGPYHLALPYPLICDITVIDFVMTRFTKSISLKKVWNCKYHAFSKSTAENLISEKSNNTNQQI